MASPDAPVDDPIIALTGLAEIPPALESAQGSLDELHRRPVIFRGSRPGGRDYEQQAARYRAAQAEATLRAAHAALALNGAEYDLDELRSGAVVDPLVIGVVRMYEALPGLVTVWRTAPPQAIAKLHVLLLAGRAPIDELGRPTAADVVHDVAALAISTHGSAVLLAAVVHAQLASAEVFGDVSGLVACASARLVLCARGADPHLLALIEHGHWQRKPEYAGALLAYRTGTVDGVRSWLKHYCEAVRMGAREAANVCDSISQS